MGEAILHSLSGTHVGSKAEFLNLLGVNIAQMTLGLKPFIL